MKGETGERGMQGPQGPQGPEGPKDESGVRDSGDVSTPSPVTPAPHPPQTPRSTPKGTSEPGFGEGTWAVGTDLEPGTYASAGGDSCYWARLSGFGGTIDDILANYRGSARSIVTIALGDGFQTDGCGLWMLVSEVAAPVGAITDGIWLVGDELPPGTYTSAGSDSCYWARLNGFGGTSDDIITNYLGSAKPIVTIAASDRGFETGGCGVWTHFS